jgi:hypothetical protein
VKAARALQQGVISAPQVSILKPTFLGKPELTTLNLQTRALVAPQLQLLAGLVRQQVLGLRL